jgi:hypothetical protein
MSEVTHVVILSLKPETAEEVSSRFFNLKSDCRKPDGTTYIKDIKGGADISIEGYQVGSFLSATTYAGVKC